MTSHALIQPSEAMDAVPQRRVLVIDDDVVQRMVVTQISQRLGQMTEGAASLEEAQARLEATSYDIVVVDLSLGAHDGVEVLRAIVETGRRPAVLVISGFDDRVRDAAIRYAEASGLQTLGSLRKPIDLMGLRGALSRPLIPVKQTRRKSASHDITREDLASALASGEITAHYQPKISLRTGQMIGVEALARWSSARHGAVPPSVFVPLAETQNLWRELTSTILHQAVADAAQWRSMGFDLQVAVNVPPCTLLDPELPDEVERVLNQFNLPPANLIIEVTESAAVTDAIATGEVLTRLRIKGVQLSIDDFGTGYSSLLSLLRLPFSELKIDRSFVQACDHDAYAWKIVRATISLAREFGMRTVAEGVETEAVAQLLLKAGCEVAQGYYFAMPAPADDLQALMQAQPQRDFLAPLRTGR